MLAQSLIDIGYIQAQKQTQTYALARPAFKPDRFEYYKMVLVYVDNILHLSHNTNPTMEALRRLHELKPELCGPPKMYLGANVTKYQLEDGRMSCGA